MIAALPTMLTSLFRGGAAAAGGAAATEGVAAEGVAAQGVAAAGARDSVSMSPAAQMMMNNSSSPGAGSPSSAPTSSIDPSSDQLPGMPGTDDPDKNGDLCGAQDQFSFDDSGEDGSVDDSGGSSQASAPDEASPQDTWSASSEQ
jgi:hypothetical protein